MDAIEFIKEKTRMCEGINDCSKCPLYDLEQSCIPDIDNIEEMVDIVEIWMKENPIITNGDKFTEVFGIVSEKDFLYFSDWLKKEYKGRK